jgi:hypothetical protein
VTLCRGALIASKKLQLISSNDGISEASDKEQKINKKC